jgi:hypothetical protein
MLTKAQLVELRALGTNWPAITGYISMLVDEIEAQRPVVLAALNCTGEDGHDGTTELVVAAKEYLDKIAAVDPNWRNTHGSANINRTTY